MDENEKQELTREYKAFKFELDNVDETTGEFSGHALVFDNVEDGNDIMERGAFAKTIVENFERIKILSQHNECDLPIGKPIELREDGKGLFVRGKISDTQKGRDVQILLKDRVLNEMSVGYEAVDFEYDDKGIRHLKEVKLWEISIVTWAMNELATIDEVKSLAENLKIEAKNGKISRSRLNALRPFIAVLRELAEVLEPFLELPAIEEKPQTEPEHKNPGKSAPDRAKEAKNIGMIFKIVPTKKM